VEALRAAGFDGALEWIGAEAHAPYDRPPLSKEVLRGEWGAERTALRHGGFGALGVEPRLGHRAVALDARERCVVLDDAARVSFDGAIVCTGAAARRLAGTEQTQLPAGVHVLRTLDDALALRAELDRSPRVAIVGAGFIGLEVAASCRARGLDVTVVEPQPAPLASVLGRELGGFCAAVHRDHGVDLRTDVAVSRIEGTTRVEGVITAGGGRIDADVVVVAIGVRPATDWLAGSGIALDDGVLCDEYCATSLPRVYAAGDVARWRHPRSGEHVRVEHWTNAAEQGTAAARNLLAGAGAQPYAPVPTFWSDQYDLKIQFAGRAVPRAEVHVTAGDLASRRFVALYGVAGKLSAVLAVRRAAQFVRWTDMLSRGTSWDDALRAAAA
jgi:3-phenylpropionate/trans-cinnamate dioxygenase ferredoxin reductase subunit